MIPRRLVPGAAALFMAAAAVLAGVSAGAASTAAAVDGGGTPGYCPTDEGVTVVVDFQQLGGGIVVRCAPGPVVRGYTGLDALQDAGFTPTGVRRYGLAFVCRIVGKPTADQDLPIQGDPDYHEACLDTPPPQAFWGYWYSPNGGSWAYSQTAAISRDAIPGGFEGWSFSLNHDPGQAPRPGIAPKRPPHAPPTSPPPTTRPPTHQPPPTHRPPTHRPPTSQPTTQPPSTHQPPTHQPPTHQQPSHHGGGTAGAGTTAPTPPGPPSRAATRPAPTSPSTETTSIADPVAAGHNRAGEKVTGELPKADDSGDGSARATVVAVGLVALLMCGAAVAAWRRRVSGE